MDSGLYSVLLHLHSVGRWIVLLLLVIAIFNSMIAGDRPFIRSDNRTGLLLTIFADLMLLIGFVLWFLGPKGYALIKSSPNFGVVMKDSVMRFFAVEHAVAMLIAIIFIHIGKAQARRKIGDRAKHRRTFVFYLIALIIILVSVPWPFRIAGSNWF